MVLENQSVECIMVRLQASACCQKGKLLVKLQLGTFSLENTLKKNPKKRKREQTVKRQGRKESEKSA